MRLTDYFSIFRHLAILSLSVFAALSVSRLLLVAIYWERVAATDGLAFIFLQGLRFDIILLGMLFGLVLVFKPWFHTRDSLLRTGRWLFPVYMGLATSLAFFVEASTRSFINEFDSRPNFLFIEYLVHPQEVFATLYGSYLLEFISFTVIALLLGWIVFRWLRKAPSSEILIPIKLCLLVTPVSVLLVVMMIRSTLTPPSG